jgi:hypothetical protein
MNPKDIVRAGYDKISHAYRSDSLDQKDPSFCWMRFVPEGNGGHTLLLAQKPAA